MCVAMIHEYPIAFACKAYLSSAFVVALFTYTHTQTLFGVILNVTVMWKTIFGAKNVICHRRRFVRS